MESATLPGLHHLHLGAPTAGSSKNCRKKKEQAKREALNEKAEAEHREKFQMDLANHNRAEYARLLDECKRFWGVDKLTEEDHVVHFIARLFRPFFEMFISGRWTSREKRDLYGQLWDEHRALLDRVQGGVDVHSLPHDPPDVVGFDTMLISKFYTFALFLLENYVRRTYPYADGEQLVDAGILKGPRSEERTPEEIDRIINTPDVRVLITGTGRTFIMLGFPEEYCEFIDQVDSYLKHLDEYMDREWWASREANQGEVDAQLAVRRQHEGAAERNKLRQNDEVEKWKQKASARLQEEAKARSEATARHGARMREQRAAQAAERRTNETRRDGHLAHPSAGPSEAHARDPAPPPTELELAQQAERQRQEREETRARVRAVREKVWEQNEAKRKADLVQEARVEKQEFAKGVADAIVNGTSGPTRPKRH